MPVNFLAIDAQEAFKNPAKLFNGCDAVATFDWDDVVPPPSRSSYNDRPLSLQKDDDIPLYKRMLDYGGENELLIP